MQHARPHALSGLATVAALLLAMAPLASAPLAAQELYGQTDLVTTPGGGAGGANASEAQVGAALDAASISALSRVADGFTVTGGQWQVTGFDFFGLSSDLVALGFASPFTYASWRLWDRRPDLAGATVVGGDLTVNAFTGTSFTGAYRTPYGVPLSATRPIDRISASANLLLDPGEYWLEWDLRRGMDFSSSVPYITRVGEQVTGDAMAYNAVTGDWNAITEQGFAQGLPFAVLGSRVVNVPVPEPGSFVLLLAALPLLAWRWRDVVTDRRARRRSAR